MARISLLAAFLFLLLNAEAQTSVLSTGNWYKFSVQKNGLYKIDFEQLKKAGIDPGKIDPRKIKIYGNPTGMLPQPNSAERAIDLLENAILVQGENDGKFDRNDVIVFYAEGADLIRFHEEREIYQCEKNLYSEENFYFLTIAETAGKRVSVSENLGTGFPVITEFDDFIYHESDLVKLRDPISGREWYGEGFGSAGATKLDFSFPVTGITATRPIKFVSHVLGQSYAETSFRVTLNGTLVSTQKMAAIPAYRYGPKAVFNRDTLLLNPALYAVTTNTSQTVSFEFQKAPGSSEGYIDRFVIDFPRTLALYGDQTIFLSQNSVNNAASRFEIGGVSADVFLWDITDPINCKQQEFTINNGMASFSGETTTLKRFVIANTKLLTPAFVKKLPNQNLHNLATPNLIIVTHENFKPEAERLANHRQSFSGWTVAVVTIDQIYNEFSSGRQDVTAVRDFMKHLYDKSPGTLKALLLFGKSSYDYKNRIKDNTNFVITYESRNSIEPLSTYSSDDYFTFLEDSEGEWREFPSQSHTLDIGVGRLPVKSLEEAKTVVDKIIRYDTDVNAQGYWRKRVVFVADDGNSDDSFNKIHQLQANTIAEHVQQLNPGIDTEKLFMGSYPKTVRPNGETVDKLTEDIIRAFELGTLIVNYTGHGSEKQWTDENVFNREDIQNLSNETYPFMVTATCEFGRHDNPEDVSGAELIVLQKDGGVIGLVTTARPVNSTTNAILNEAFYDALLQRNDHGSYDHLGENYRKTKNSSTSGVANRNFSLLGDPSLTLALPSYEVFITELKTASGSDTLKALSYVTAKGEIRTISGEKITDFNGTLEATLFDKEVSFTTFGKGDPYSYSQWQNALFRGKASITSGEFEFDFMLPKNIAYQIAPGRLSLYATDPESQREAIGSTGNFKIGGSEPSVADERVPPQIQLFIGDSSFVNGGLASPDTWLIANLSDDSGINISGYGIGNSIFAVLDDDIETFVLNDYYSADKDDATSGWLKFPLRNLAPGKHRITLKAWDLFNNNSVSTVEFVVTDGDEIVIESFGNYPNPFKYQTTLNFTHNRSGDDLQAQLFILNLAGEVVHSSESEIPASTYEVNIMEINASEESGKKLPAGLYLARLIVRSLSNGSKNEQVTKLIVLN